MRTRVFRSTNSPRLAAGDAGFTLVELLVVIAIIGVLVALLLPAVQAAREAARRSKCQNNLKQLAIACHNHEDTFKKFPYATKADVLDAYNWMHLLLPYVEQKAVYDLYADLGLPISQTGDWPESQGFETAAPYVQARTTILQVHLCPSDRSHVMNEAQVPYYTRARGNYRGCAGNGDLYGNIPDGAPSGYVSSVGVFSVMRGQVFGTAVAPKQSNFANMIDGSSNTVMFAEALKAATDNWSTIGDITLGNMGGSMCSTFLTPNSTAADRVWGPCPQPQGDGGYRWPCTTLGGPLRPPGNHNNNQQTAHAAARSLHPGGVNISLGDGSVRFVSQTIDINTWRALGTARGSETLPNF